MLSITKRSAGVFFAALIVAVGGLVYELIISTAASYLLGDSVTQFSLTIGVMLFAMGIGAFLAPKLAGSAEDQFVTVETCLALIGGNSVALLYSLYAYFDAFYLLFLTLVLLVGVLIGFEIPVMLKLLERKKDMILITSRILSLDYFGALIAAVLYPLVLLPQLGVMRSAYLVGLLNISIAGLMIWLFYPKLSRPKLSVGAAVATALILVSGLVYHVQIATFLNHKLYQDEVIYSEQTAYQNIVITRFDQDIRLYLDGNIQFSSIDEYRYHEPLVHIPLLAAYNPKKILVLGGGDGMVVREILKHPSVESITLVELDQKMIALAQHHPLVTELNGDSLWNEKVNIVIADAFSYLEKNDQLYDSIIIDLPDPNNESLAKLYSIEFYQLVARRLAADGVMVTQATSPYFTNHAFWVIAESVATAGLTPTTYHSDVPSFGEWGFVMGHHQETNLAHEFVTLNERRSQQLEQLNLRYLTPSVWPQVFMFDPDTAKPAELPYEASSIFNPSILRAYHNEVVRW